MIPFNKRILPASELTHVVNSMKGGQLSGDGPFSKLCCDWFEKELGCIKSLLTPSCTSALEMAAILMNIQPGDEVIMPSFTFTSSANAFVLRGAHIKFVDIRPDTMNVDEELIEAAITSNTRAIVVVHYAGVSCEMDRIMDIASAFDLFVIEDAAQGMMSSYNSRPLGSIGHFGCISFHETKNYTSGGEGGLLAINDDRFKETAEILRDKGTNRGQFLRGDVDKYTWVGLGSSFLMNDLSAAYLWGQIERAEEVNLDRFASWHRYYGKLAELRDNGLISLPFVPSNCQINGHIFFLKVKDLDERTQFIEHLRKQSVFATFHYVPLHKSLAGRKFGEFVGEDRFTSSESERLVRLPIYFGMTADEVDHVVKAVRDFFDVKARNS